MVFIHSANDPNPIIVEKHWDGELLREPIGVNGFGYDPIFYLPDRDCSSAQLQPKVKNEISHRGQALSELLKQLLSFE
jgi:XTP/dITP diphosphohydrolase